MASKSNSRQTLDEYARRIHGELKAAERNSHNSLNHYRMIGVCLFGAKLACEHGQFTEWCEKNCGVSHTSCHRYIQLASGWEAYEERLAELHKTTAPASEHYSLTFALRLIRGEQPAEDAKPAQLGIIRGEVLGFRKELDGDDLRQALSIVDRMTSKKSGRKSAARKIYAFAQSRGWLLRDLLAELDLENATARAIWSAAAKGGRERDFKVTSEVPSSVRRTHERRRSDERRITA